MENSQLDKGRETGILKRFCKILLVQNLGKSHRKMTYFHFNTLAQVVRIGKIKLKSQNEQLSCLRNFLKQ